MRPLYKYLPLKYATKLVEKGEVKIGTLIGYQNEDEFGKDIGDEGEGTLEQWSRINNRKIETSDDLIGIEKQIIGIRGTIRGDLIFKNMPLSLEHRSNDLYVYSTSRYFNVQIMRNLSRDYKEQYDACVKINNPNKFIEIVSNALKKKGKFESINKCRYTSRNKHHSEPVPHPVFIKVPEYQYQEEVRIVWSPLDKEKIKPEILELSDLKNVCEMCFIDEGHFSETGLPMATEMVFDNDLVKLDYSAYSGCTFKNSSIINCAEGGIYVIDSKFLDCSFLISGNAQKTIKRLKDIYNNFGDSGKELIENIFDGIRGK